MNSLVWNEFKAQSLSSPSNSTLTLLVVTDCTDEGNKDFNTKFQ